MLNIMDKILELLNYMSINIKEIITKTLISHKLNPEILEEIRLRTNKKIAIKSGQDIVFLEYKVKQEDILETFEKVCENSIYSYKKQICEGFITIKGGNRVGIAGSAVIEDQKIINIEYISSLNFRISRERLGCSKEIIKNIIDIENDTIFNSLIVSPPGGGKTTILKDLVRTISTGISEFNFSPKTCGVVDERGEIAAMYRGIPQNELGPLTDIVENIPKNKGMTMLIRSMSPSIIFCDEIGSKEDIEAIRYAICSGVKGIFTAHSDSIKDLRKNVEFGKLLTNHLIQRVIVLDNIKKGQVKELYKS